MERVVTIGFDIAKSVFQVHGIDATGGEYERIIADRRGGAPGHHRDPGRDRGGGPGARRVARILRGRARLGCERAPVPAGRTRSARSPAASLRGGAGGLRRGSRPRTWTAPDLSPRRLRSPG